MNERGWSRTSDLPEVLYDFLEHEFNYSMNDNLDEADKDQQTKQPDTPLKIGDKFTLTSDMGKLKQGEEVTVISARPDN